MINNVVLMGRLTADPELKHTSGDISYTFFSLAVDRGYVKSGEDRQTDFIDITAWRKTAEFICKYFRKGQMIALEGSIRSENYTDQDGNKRKSVKIYAEHVHFCSGKSESNAQSAPSAANPAAVAPAPDYSSGPNSDFEQIPLDDDLPF